MKRSGRSSRTNQGTANGICDPGPQVNELGDRNIPQIKREEMFISQDCESNLSGEDNASGSSVPEEAECRTLVCGDCGKIFSQRHLLTRHKREVHRPNHNLVCKECGKKSSSSGGLYHHMKSHLPPAYECAECGRKFDRKKTLASHWHRLHGDSTQIQKEVHVRPKSPKCNTGTDQVLLKCCDCDKTYMSATGLSRHRATVHLQKFPHTCITCGQAFTQKSSLLRHQKVHTKVRPFQCGYCVAAFKDKWHLTQHERIHTGAVPYVCTICDKSFKLKTVLREHIHEEHGPSKRKCPECSHTCKTFDALASHWKQKHASGWVHKNSSEGHSVHSNEEIPSLSVEWRNNHAIKWANPKTRRKRERINIALLEALADLSSLTEYEDRVNNDSEELAVCNNKCISQMELLSQGIPGNYSSLDLSSLASRSDEELHVASTDTVKVEIN
ncbi:gastrula zinc finger protein XlCGF26.1-like isoform X1 [Schistocerca gregaria]|uniref:gastrula zinc finger protein XlCGF26.1-like isoform X1 n=2 Tax=Schistocerca gregaria TaxID=7010 RepID=UPI00211F17ED|nr:gastrula zinc finger protein XlCGF26.1-like isoform X1 [Schistocerca gregaria]